MAGNNSSFLVKRRSAGGVQFSRDPLNVANLNNRKHAGFANDKAVGIQPTEKGGISLITKKPQQHSRPATQLNQATFHGRKSGPKVYKTIAGCTARQGYRPDLLPEAVARASRIRETVRPKKKTPEQKPRGAKARKE